jgi:hypothetical protein
MGRQMKCEAINLSKQGRWKGNATVGSGEIFGDRSGGENLRKHQTESKTMIRGRQDRNRRFGENQMRIPPSDRHGEIKITRTRNRRGTTNPPPIHSKQQENA